MNLMNLIDLCENCDEAATEHFNGMLLCAECAAVARDTEAKAEQRYVDAYGDATLRLTSGIMSPDELARDQITGGELSAGAKPSSGGVHLREGDDPPSSTPKGIAAACSSQWTDDPPIAVHDRPAIAVALGAVYDAMGRK